MQKLKNGSRLKTKNRKLNMKSILELENKSKHELQYLSIVLEEYSYLLLESPL